MEVPLTQGKVARIDPQDWPLIELYRWYAARPSGGRWYAHATPPDGSPTRTELRMHTLIIGTAWVDHRDCDGLNNVRDNLRLCTNAENQQNTDARGGSSRFKGVSWHKRHGRWRVIFNWQGKTHWVGYYDDELDAARAYNAAILPLAGECARLNVL